MADTTMQAALEKAFAEAVETTEAPAEGTTVEAVETPAAAEVVAPAEDPSTGSEAKSETVAVPEAIGTEELPEEYFGVSRSGLDDESWKAVIGGFADRDAHIQTLLRERAAAAVEPVAAAAPVEPTPTGVSDADILVALGLDPENDMDDERTAKVAVPLARMVLDLKSQVEDVQEHGAAVEAETFWRTSLKSMEEAYGPLPRDISHEDVMRASATGGIGDPVDAYWRVMGPARSSILADVNRRKNEAESRLKSTQSTASKPAASPKTEPAAIVAKDVSAAIKDAFKSLNDERQWATTEYGEE